jgi:hypothetical protein
MGTGAKYSVCCIIQNDASRRRMAFLLVTPTKPQVLEVATFEDFIQYCALRGLRETRALLPERNNLRGSQELLVIL